MPFLGLGVSLLFLHVVMFLLSVGLVVCQGAQRGRVVYCLPGEECSKPRHLPMSNMAWCTSYSYPAPARSAPPRSPRFCVTQNFAVISSDAPLFAQPKSASGGPTSSITCPEQPSRSHKPSERPDLLAFARSNWGVFALFYLLCWGCFWWHLRLSLFVRWERVRLSFVGVTVHVFSFLLRDGTHTR